MTLSNKKEDIETYCKKCPEGGAAGSKEEELFLSFLHASCRVDKDE